MISSHQINNRVLLVLLTKSRMGHQLTPAHAIYAKAFPHSIKGFTETSIVWGDGTEMAVSDGKESQRSFLERLNNATLLDQISIPYVSGQAGIAKALEPDYDPGRLHNYPFLYKMYGATKAEVEQNLVEIDWLPKSFPEGHLRSDGTIGRAYKLKVSKVNDLAAKFKNVSAELDLLPPIYRKYLEDPSGTFNWRKIAGTDRHSTHSFGMTIDLNARVAEYWLWDYKESLGMFRESTDVGEADVDPARFPPYHNSIPWPIVEIFEKNGFIWGGKWFHYDTMHFEYHPELFPERYL